MNYPFSNDYEKILGYIPDTTTSYIISPYTNDPYPLKRRLGIIYAKVKEEQGYKGEIHALSVDTHGEPYFRDTGDCYIRNDDIITQGEPINFADIDRFFRYYEGAEDILPIIKTIKELGFKFIEPKDDLYEIYLFCRQNPLVFCINTLDNDPLLPFGDGEKMLGNKWYKADEPETFEYIGKALGVLRYAFNNGDFMFKLNFHWATDIWSKKSWEEVEKERGTNTTYEEQCEFEKITQEKYGYSWADEFFEESNKFLKKNKIDIYNLG